MMTRHKLKNAVWIDLEQPTHEDIVAVAREAGFGERISREVIDPTPAPLVLSEERAVLLVVHFPALDDNDQPLDDHEVDFVVTRDFLVTVRYRVVPAIHELHKVLEANELLGATALSIEEVLELITSKLFSSVRSQVNVTVRGLDKVEKALFREGSREAVHAISHANRALLHLEATLASQESPFANFLEVLQEREMFGPSFHDRVNRLIAERDQVARLLATHREVAAELRETNAALLNATQNEIMKTLTVITFIILPLTFIASLFQMNLLGGPLSTNPHGFWIVVSGMLIISSLLTLFFARKRWL